MPALNRLYQRLVPNFASDGFLSWEGCPAFESCFHHRDEVGPTALCRACDKFDRRVLRLKAKEERERRRKVGTGG